MSRGWSRRRILTRLRRFVRNDQLVLLSLALGVGVASGYAAIGFRELVLWIQFAGFQTASENMIAHVAALPPWQRVLVPTAGGLMIGLFIYFFMPGRRPRGMADAIEGAVLRSGRMNAKEGVLAGFISALSIGTGGSVGREGPVVHLGATIGSWLSQTLHLSRSQMVTLLGAGVASAVSASFNAPIAGAIFALEVVIGHYALSAFAPIVIAAVSGAIIARIHFGDFPAFVVPEQSLVSFWEFPAFAILGVLAGITAIAFLRGTALTAQTAEKVAVPQWLRPAVGGLLLGIIAVAFPEVLGVGYGTTDAALKGSIGIELLVALLFAKMAATVICVGTGWGGGVFSPSLFMGAMLGGAFGVVATSVFPDYSSGHNAYTLIGMGAVAGSVLGAPISTILIIFELTANYALTIGVMVAVVIASVIMQQVSGGSFFTWQLERRGINIRGGREVGFLGGITVAHVMKAEYTSIPPTADMQVIREKLIRAPFGELFVCDDEGGLHGTITLADLSDTAFDMSVKESVKAEDVARKHPPALEPGDSLDRAIALMQDVGEEHLAVVEDHKSMRLVGFVHEVDVMFAYNRALMEARREERGELAGDPRF